MRRNVTIWILAILTFLGLGIYTTFNLLTLLIDSEGPDAILRSELPASLTAHLSVTSDHLLIPKIIHQTYKNTSIPEGWQFARKTCIDLHPDYEHRLWTDASSRVFIADEYPWFLATWDGYRFPIQRADAIRYFVLSHFGGVYIDLDNGCNRRLDPLLVYPAFLRRTDPTGISNDLMGCTRGHKFFVKATASLKAFDRSWGLPYVTIMSSTGPLFLSVIWKKYNRAWSGQEIDRVRLLLPDEATTKDWSFFLPFIGSSWHGPDAKILFFVGDHVLLIVFAGTVAVLTLLVGVYRLVAKLGAWNARRLLRRRGRHPSPRGWRGSPRGFRKEGERYGLIERHEV